MEINNKTPFESRYRPAARRNVQRFPGSGVGGYSSSSRRTVIREEDQRQGARMLWREDSDHSRTDDGAPKGDRSGRDGQRVRDSSSVSWS